MNKENKKERLKKPWPTKAAMEQVYEKKLWGGGNEFSFYSGEGSHFPEIVNPYTEVLISFFKYFQRALKVCDLGCGDFNVGKELVLYTKEYIAIDIVEPLIKYNKQKFKAINLEFQCLDIAADILPVGDCVIIRQVLQHLSNREVQAVLDKLTFFKYIILTEHIPTGDFIPNKDIVSGQGIRIKKQSGLNILEAPFDFKVRYQKVLCDVFLGEKQGRIVTWLYEI